MSEPPLLVPSQHATIKSTWPAVPADPYENMVSNKSRSEHFGHPETPPEKVIRRPSVDDSMDLMNAIKEARKDRKSPLPEYSGRWTTAEHNRFLDGLKKYGKQWRFVRDRVKTRTVTQVRTHAQKHFAKLAKAKNPPRIKNKPNPLLHSPKRFLSRSKVKTIENELAAGGNLMNRSRRPTDSVPPLRYQPNMRILLEAVDVVKRELIENEKTIEHGYDMKSLKSAQTPPMLSCTRRQSYKHIDVIPTAEQCSRQIIDQFMNSIVTKGKVKKLLQVIDHLRSEINAKSNWFGTIETLLKNHHFPTIKSFVKAVEREINAIPDLALSKKLEFIFSNFVCDVAQDFVASPLFRLQPSNWTEQEETDKQPKDATNHIINKSTEEAAQVYSFKSPINSVCHQEIRLPKFSTLSPC